MTGTTVSIDDTITCLEVAASSAITDYADVLVRGYLKEHPAGVLFRIGQLEDMTAAVRAAAERELADGKWDVPAPFDPVDEHEEAVAGYAAHTCDCEWCRRGRPAFDPLRFWDGTGDC